MASIDRQLRILKEVRREERSSQSGNLLTDGKEMQALANPAHVPVQDAWMHRFKEIYFSEMMVASDSELLGEVSAFEIRRSAPGISETNFKEPENIAWSNSAKALLQKVAEKSSNIDNANIPRLRKEVGQALEAYYGAFADVRRSPSASKEVVDMIFGRKREIEQHQAVPKIKSHEIS
ncbi:hypothetical protein FACS189425_00370 [Clostridia bacterium]|nr:hypothetical protein FACS189425_00370 [Clostridia bacterium]